MAEPQYYFREDLEAEKDRQAEIAPATLAAPAPTSAPSPVPAAPKAGPNPFQALGAAMPKAAPKPDYFADFRASLEAQNPFKQQAQQAVSQTLQNPTAGFDAAAGAEKDRLGREIAAEGERRRQQATLAYGGAQTGQAGRAMDAFGNEALMRQAELGRDLAAGRAQAGEQARGNAVGQSLALLGEERSGVAQAAGLGLQQEGQRADLGLRGAELAQREKLQSQALASQEKVAFAGLAQGDRQIAQQAMQFDSRLDFDRSTLAANMDDAQRQRIWQAVEAEKARTSQERIAFAGLDLERDKFSAADANAKQGLSLDANAQAMARLGMDREEAYRYASLAKAFAWAEKGLTLDESAQQLTRDGMTAENARYFAGLAQQDRLATQDIASREKLAFAQLSQEDKALAQQAMLEGNRLSWEEKALKMGLDDKAIDRIWNAAEGEKERKSRETLAYAQIGSQEKLQATQQVWEAAQNELGRTLETMLSNDRIAAQFQMADLDQRFQERMQASGFVQETEMETMRSELQERLQARGLSAEQAKQVADQKFTEMMAGRDQAFELQMNDIRQKFVTGERVDAQTWESAMKAGEMAHQETMTKLESTLRLGEQQNAQAFQSAFQEMQNSFTLFRDEQGFDRETATRMATEQFQERMTNAGFTHEEAMQGAQLATQISENQKSRASQEMMSAAQLAMTDKNFQAELRQRYQFTTEDLKLRRQELTGQLTLMGLQGQQLEAAIADQKVSSAMEIVALGMEIGDGSPESMAPFVEQFGAALEGYMKGQGIDIASSDFVKAMTAKTGSGTTLVQAKPPTIEVVQEGIDTLKTLTDKLGQGTDVAKLSDSLSKLGTWWNSNGGAFYKSSGIEGFMSDPNSVATVMNIIGPLYKAGLDKATIRQVAAFLPGDVIDRVLGNAGVQ